MPNESGQLPEDELNCAEEVLDAYAAELGLEETSFDCIGDYITAVVEGMRKKRQEAVLAKPLNRRVTNFHDQALNADAMAEAMVKLAVSTGGLPGNTETTGEASIKCPECNVGTVSGKKVMQGIHDEMTITGAKCFHCGKSFSLTFNV